MNEVERKKERREGGKEIVSEKDGNRKTRENKQKQKKMFLENQKYSYRVKIHSIQTLINQHVYLFLVRILIRYIMSISFNVSTLEHQT